MQVQEPKFAGLLDGFPGAAPVVRHYIGQVSRKG
jgi:hypothetical protein